ncbi:MAG TPA: hypothetical protein ENJ09_01185 [Planctomycetes bacterium]|nr:hypothetical protein [Planctomycetota bacterium]
MPPQSTPSVRRIGLSLGADDCWPLCYEGILSDLDLELALGKERVRFEVERVPIVPFSLRAPQRYDLVIDRLTHWYDLSREWIKKSILLDGLYVFNNPWAVQSMEKHTSYCAMMRLGMPIPETWLIPPKEYEDKPDLNTTLQRYAKMFELGDVGDAVGYPAFLKPFDGGGWVGVSRIENRDDLQRAYDASGKFVMHLQASVEGYERFVRCIGVGPQRRFVNYDPTAPLHARYTKEKDFLSPADELHLEKVLLTINAFFGWDFNSCECLSKDGTWHPIDFANPCPDSQVTSLHIHFPWLIKSILRWSLFCAATKRPVRPTLEWERFFEIADTDLPYAEKLDGYAALARDHFQTDAFDAFCEEHLGDLDEVAWEYFGSDRARDAVHRKVRSLFPEHEWESFTEMFWQDIQAWREEDAAERAATAKR